mmetsp:Transcript_38/g.59  ORF Transcript_38/g.59 Transcript_38/m.59 type:complete len:235 (-) Transcript_38:145-849(-)
MCYWIMRNIDHLVTARGYSTHIAETSSLRTVRYFQDCIRLLLRTIKQVSLVKDLVRSEFVAIRTDLVHIRFRNSYPFGYGLETCIKRCCGDQTSTSHGKWAFVCQVVRILTHNLSSLHIPTKHHIIATPSMVGAVARIRSQSSGKLRRLECCDTVPYTHGLQLCNKGRNGAIGFIETMLKSTSHISMRVKPRKLYKKHISISTSFIASSNQLCNHGKLGTQTGSRKRRARAFTI